MTENTPNKEDALLKAAQGFKDISSIIKTNRLSSTAKIMVVLETVKRPEQQSIMANMDKVYPQLLEVTRIEAKSTKINNVLNQSSARFAQTQSAISSLLSELAQKKPESYNILSAELGGIKGSMVDPISKQRDTLENELAHYLTKKNHVTATVINALVQGKETTAVRNILDDLLKSQNTIADQVETLISKENKVQHELDNFHLKVYRTVETTNKQLAPASVREKEREERFKGESPS